MIKIKVYEKISNRKHEHEYELSISNDCSSGKKQPSRFLFLLLTPIFHVILLQPACSPPSLSLFAVLIILR